MNQSERSSIMGDGPRLALYLFPILGLAILATVLLPRAFAFAGRLYGLAYVTGIVLAALGLLFQASSAYVLISSYRAGRLATWGSYGLCRHPIFAWWVFSVLPALALILNSWLFLAVAVLFRILSGKLAKREEAELVALFGLEYELYQARVRAFLPLPRLRPLTGRRVLKALAGLAVLGLLALAIFLGLAKPLVNRLGATRAEAQAPMAGDAYISPEAPRYTQAIDIDASPEAVWPWLVQVGYKRAGWYNLDGINRLAGADYFFEGGASARRIIPELQGLAVGDKIHLVPPLGMTVVELAPPRSLVLVADPDHKGGDNVAWTFALAPRPEGGSRLYSRFASTTPGPPVLQALMAFINDFGGATIQQPAMLWGLKLRAEGRTMLRTRAP